MIRNIIFDLGNVLVRVDYTKFKSRLKEDGVTDKDYNDFFGSDDHYRKYFDMGYESGRLTTNEFLAKCIEGMKLKMSPQEYADAFNDMFIAIEPMAELVKKLASEKKHRLFLLSNTSELHFEHIQKNYEFVNLLDEFALSYKLKALKPEEVIYRRAVQLFNAKPDECVFIDDIKANCEGAERIGIHTIQYEQNDHPAFTKQFEKVLSQNN